MGNATKARDLCETITDKNGNWRDATGVFVPESYVPDDERKKHRLVENLFKKALKLFFDLSDFKAEAFGRCEKYLFGIAKKHEEEDWQGNYTLMNFPSTKKIVVKVRDQIVFSEKIQLAKRKFDKYIESHSENIDPGLKTLIDHVFSVNKEGQYDKKRLIQLRQVNIKDKVWKEGIELLNEAERVVGSKRYMAFYMRKDNDPEGEWELVALNFAAI